MDDIASALGTVLGGKNITVAKDGDDKLKFTSTDAKLTIEAADGAEDDFKALGFSSKQDAVRTSEASADAPKIET